jgi:hypothetical protein
MSRSRAATLKGLRSRLSAAAFSKTGAGVDREIVERIVEYVLELEVELADLRSIVKKQRPVPGGVCLD